MPRGLTLRRLVLALIVLCACASPARAQLALEPVGTFAEPTYLTAPPGDTARLFVTERAGYVRVVQPNAAPQLFLDLHTLIGATGEGGLLSLAFAPDYAVSGRLYVFYTAVDRDIHVREYRVSADRDRAEPSSGRDVLIVPHREHNSHNGGQVAFGPDGFLYIGTGDGGGAGDPLNNAQNPGVLLGKLLRIDPRGAAPGEHAIPQGNAPGAAPQVWALGLRNPWRFSFDRITGALLVGDVGQNGWEEVDYVPAGSPGGANFGWRHFEGSHVFDAAIPIFGGNAVGPVFEYAHAGAVCAITGGFVVRDASVPSLHGRYVYADYCAGALRSLVPALPAARDDRSTGLTATLPISFGEDGLCRVYVLGQGGDVRRLVERPAAAPAGCSAAPPGPQPPPPPAAPVPPAPPKPPSPTTPTTPAEGVGSAAAPLQANVGAAAEHRLRAALRRGLRARCALSEAGRCTVFATMAAKTARALGLARRGRVTPVSFAQGTVVLKAGGTRMVTLRLTGPARRALAGRATPFRAAMRLWAQARTADGRHTADAARVVLARR